MWRKIMNKQKEITQKQYVGIGKNFDYYIRESDICLRTDECIVIHLDGIGFTHKYYNKFSEDITSQTNCHNIILCWSISIKRCQKYFHHACKTIKKFIIR